MTTPPDSANCNSVKHWIRPAWTGTWHVWRIIIPRRSISGKLLHGTVLRRHNGRHWIYKRYVEPDEPT